MQALRTYLKAELRDRQARNDRYSLRAFAAHLGVSPTSLSLFLNEKRALSAASTQRIAEALGRMNAPEAASLLRAVRAPSSATPTYTALDMDKMAVLADWYYFAILSLLELDGFDPTPAKIARRLNLPRDTVEAALATLLQLEMLARDGAGKLRPTGKSFATPTELSHVALRRSHFQALELAKASLERDPIEQRNFVSMTMAIDPDRLPEAKRRIQMFNRRLCAYLEGGSKKEVYRLCVQLFPLSR